ncbi:hypothetical protein FB384_004185 [Prauserella sediminis]|uniref:Uncharacterized protein n=1 Tax=Prauserella sediminis TaxID=577680 RepID=A0A839XMZ3_9PSEU|nr:hypothetical protein [Prauserella sediminis]
MRLVTAVPGHASLPSRMGRPGVGAPTGVEVGAQWDPGWAGGKEGTLWAPPCVGVPHRGVAGVMSAAFLVVVDINTPSSPTAAGGKQWPLGSRGCANDASPGP